MRKFHNISILSLFLLFPLTVFCQYPVIIDDPIYGGYYHPQQEILLDACNKSTDDQVSYWIDLDRDGTNDLNFFLDEYMGGLYHHNKIQVFTNSGFTVLVDTNYYATNQYIDSLGQVQNYQQQYTVVKRFYSGGTLLMGEPAQPGYTTIVNIYKQHFPSYVPTNINYFLGKTAFIVIYQDDGPSSWIYYFKVHVYNDQCRLKIYYGRTNNVIVTGINQSDQHGCVFPNPVHNLAIIPDGFKYANIYSRQGILHSSFEINENENTLDLSGLKAGLYFVKLIGDDTERIEKVIKQ